MTPFRSNRFLGTALAAVAVAALATSSASAIAAGNMTMGDNGPAHFPPTRQAYTTNHDFLVKLVTLPQPIPYQKYFTIDFAVYDGHHPKQRLHNVTLSMFAGMRHGLKHGFRHGMDSSPKIIDHDGMFRIEGMYFHMMGKWTLKLTVAHAGQTGIAYFDLPCCGQ